MKKKMHYCAWNFKDFSVKKKHGIEFTSARHHAIPHWHAATSASHSTHHGSTSRHRNLNPLTLEFLACRKVHRGEVPRKVNLIFPARM